MKRTIPFAFAFILSGLISCSEDFLDIKPYGALNETILQNKDGIEGLLIAAYDMLNGGTEVGLESIPDQQIFGTIRGGECFKACDAGVRPFMLEFSKYAVSTGNNDILVFWRNYFNAISRCNTLLYNLPHATGMTTNQKNKVAAEGRYLRAHYYFYLKRVFKNIPWIDENTKDVRVPNTFSNDGFNFVNIWPQIAEDMDFARKNLPVSQHDIGRPNKWAADIYYAKILIYRANEGEYPNGYNEALAILNDAIQNGVTASGASYDLEPYFHDSFNCSTENGPESVWAVQYTVNDGTPVSGGGGSPNGDPKSVMIGSQAANAPGLGKGWGYLCPTPFYADMFRVDENGLPYLDFYDSNSHRLKNDYGLAPATPGIEDTFRIDISPVDPRLDWTISRRNVPILDYGNMPGSAWIRNPGHNGPYMVKKWYIWKNEYGTFTAVGNANTALNVQVIRFADVLLLAAECAAREDQLELARMYVNRIRQRMIDNEDNPLHWVKKYKPGTTDQWSTENAANYQIGIYDVGLPNDPFLNIATALDAILYERALELGTEGHRFFDVARFGKGEYIFNLFIETDQGNFDYLADGRYTDEPVMYLPIPRDAIDRSLKEGVNTLTQNPGY